MKFRYRWKNPRLLPEMRNEQLEWLKKPDAMRMWLNQQDSGSKFFFPKAVRREARRMAKEAIAAYRVQQQYMDQSTVKEVNVQSDIAALIEYMHKTWDEASLYSITTGMAAKASRTGMTEFYLPSDYLPADSGVIVWQNAIGAAEHYSPATKYEADPETGAPTAVTYYSLYNLIMSDDALPVVAASWRRSEEGLFVVFWTDAEPAINAIQTLTEKQKQKALRDHAPFVYEREQILPLDEKRPWFTSKEENRLLPTARGTGRDARTLKLAEERRTQGLPMLEQMVRTFTATLLYMRNAEENRETVYPSRTVSRGMMRQGVPSRIAESPVNLVKMGQPMRYRPPKRKEDAEWHWTERRVVEPYIRHKQYVPATGETREGVFEVSGYIAGPPDAPIRNIDKVFLLADS